MPRSLDGAFPARTKDFSIARSDAALEFSVQRQRNVRRYLRLLLESLLLLALVCLIFVRLPQVEGRSMLPQIQQGNHVLINTSAYDIRLGAFAIHRHAIERGDVVAFNRNVDDQQKLFLKRVIGLPGDTIQIVAGQTYVNHKIVTALFESVTPGTLEERTIPAGSYFLMGDNRADSDDSRAFGPVPSAAIIGKAIMVVWPLDLAHRVK